MCVVHWSILGHLLKELAGLVGKIKAELTLRGPHTVCVVHWSIFGHLLKELSGLVGENTFKAKLSLQGLHTACLLTGRFLGI